MYHKAAIHMHLFIYLLIYHAQRRLVQPGAARHRTGPVVQALAGPARDGRAEMLAVGAPREQARQHRLTPGLEKTRFFKKKKTSPVVFFGFFRVFWGFFFGFLGLLGFVEFFGFFWVFWVFLYICPEERVFRVFLFQEYF
jgi:hypothetical protein